MSKKKTGKKRQTGFVNQIELKTISRARKDIASWKRALRMTEIQDNPKYYLLQQLYDDIMLDALLTSQYKNRELKVLSEPIVILNSNGKVDEKQTKIINEKSFVADINKAIFEARFYGYSLIEFSYDKQGNLVVESIPRYNLDPKGGFVYPDYTEDKKINYRELSEFGTWILEFKDKGDKYGLLNKAVPHVLFKRFAHSAYSEFAEIYGIPPRVLKTDVQDPVAMQRGKQMMQEMGAAAWMIIDESEEFEFARGVSSNGDVYSNLINLCNNELSMLISGAIIGQDTKNGSRSKDESSRKMLQELINNDLQWIAQNWNNIVIPALIKIGELKGDVSYGYQPEEDLEGLWKKTTEALPYYDIDPNWLKSKFGIEIIGKRNQGQNLNHTADDFFD